MYFTCNMVCCSSLHFNYKNSFQAGRFRIGMTSTVDQNYMFKSEKADVSFTSNPKLNLLIKLKYYECVKNVAKNTFHYQIQPLHLHFYTRQMRNRNNHFERQTY